MNEKIIETAREELKRNNIYERLSEFGKPLFLFVSGSYGEGFASKASDIDIRGVYQAPTQRFLGFRKNSQEPTFVYMSPDRKLDVSVDEIGHYLGLLSRSNGPRLEWINNPLVVFNSEELGKLRDLANTYGMAKSLANEYLHFARDIRRGKTRGEGIKKCLHASRVYMTGITIFEEGKVITDVGKLNEKFQSMEVGEMIRAKQTEENYTGNPEELERLFDKFDQRLVRAANESDCPETADTRRFEEYLINLRIGDLR